MRARERDERDLHRLGTRQIVDRQAHAVHGDGAVRDRDLSHRARHAQVIDPGVTALRDPLHQRDAVHVALHDVTAQTIRGAQRPLQIHRASHCVFPQQRAPLGRLHHVHRERAPCRTLDREACPVHRDALTPLDALVWGTDHEAQPRFPFPVSRFPRRFRDPPDRAHDPGKHIRLSNTNNVSGDDITQVGTSGAVFTRSAVWLSMARRSNTTRTGGRRGVTRPRTVSCGLSRSAVIPPTAIASNPARSQWTYSRAASPETQRELPAASAMRPSIDVASFKATNGRSACSRANRNGALSAAAASASRPRETITPLARSFPAPPRACGSGSATAATTRATPAARIASVQGGVLPWCAHGSRFTTSVAPRARGPAASSATTSACEVEGALHRRPFRGRRVIRTRTGLRHLRRHVPPWDRNPGTWSRSSDPFRSGTRAPPPASARRD